MRAMVAQLASILCRVVGAVMILPDEGTGLPEYRCCRGAFPRLYIYLRADGGSDSTQLLKTIRYKNYMYPKSP
ncbi:hypothetical protein J3F84DRAFT_369006 [Trichoderma pleuroticola]